MPAIDPLLPIPLTILLFGFVFLFALKSYLKIDKSTGDKKTLISLRAFSLLILLVISLRPRLEYTEEKTQKDRLYFLYDRSQSMTIRDMPGRQNRIDYIDAAVEKNNNELYKLKERFDLKEYSFASDLEKDPKSVKASNSTALGTALYKTAVDSRIRKVKGIVLFSDGINTGGPSINRAVSELKRRNIPVYTVMTGQSRFQSNNVDGVIKEINCPQSVKIGKKLSIDIHGVTRGLKSTPVKLEILIDDKAVQEMELSPDADEKHFYEKIEIDIDRFGEGYRKLSARLNTGQREISPANNILNTYFQIKNTGLKVLLLATSPSPDFKFASRVLSKMPDVSTTAPNPFLCRTAAGKKTLTELKPADFDAILMLNPDLELLPLELIKKCEAFMKARKQGLLVSGEILLKSLFEKKLLLEYLPVTPEPYSFLSKKGKLNCTETGKGHFITQFLINNRQSELAPISGRSATLKAGISSKTLLEQDNTPILTVDQFQSCRVAWLNTDGLWQWMTDPAFKQNYQQLWKRIIYHLAHREEDLSASLAVFSSKTRYKAGEKILVNADFLDEKGTPVQNAGITMTSKMETEGSEQRKSAFTFNNGFYSNETSFKTGGLYNINASTFFNGENLQSNDLKIFIQEVQTEFEQSLADRQLMTKVAEVTGGEFVKAEDINALFQKLQENSKLRSIRTLSSKKDAWDNIYTYLLAALFLSLEWFNRRRIGLA